MTYYVKEVEGLLEYIIFDDPLGIDGGWKELTEVDSARTIDIYLLYNIVNITYVALQTEALSEYFYSLGKLIFSDGAITVVV